MAAMGASDPRQEHYVFAHVALRNSVVGQPEAFWNAMASSAASDALAGLWEAVQESLKRPKQAPEGLSGSVRHFKGGKLALVRLPTPEAMTECWFVAVVIQPEFRYFTLEWTELLEGGHATVLCEWRKQGNDFTHVNFGEGPPATEAAFLEAVERLVRGESPAPAADAGATPCDFCGEPGEVMSDPGGKPISLSLCPKHAKSRPLPLHCGILVLIAILLLSGGAALLWWLLS